jgi:rod shape determining protein RodA
MFESRLRKNLDKPLLILTYLTALLGILMIYSATHGDPGAYHKKQMIWVVIGSVGLVLTTGIDYHLYARFARHLYILNLLLLTLILKVGHTTNGAVRWIRVGSFQFQPSEFAKLFLILTLAIYLTKRQETIREFKTLFLSFLYVAIPITLIFKQPDLGTALVVLAIWFGMVYMAGARLKHLFALVVAGSLLFTGLWISGKVIRSYQKQRLVTFINPEADPNKAGYHVMQARIAIGSGGMWGKGLLRSTVVRGGYIPEKQTDFIFTTVGEEFGFIGTVVVVALYGGILFRGSAIIAANDKELLGKLIAAGIVTMFAFHVIVNIGMNIGIMPVAGVPLPLISAGGSNMLTTLLCIGLLESISMHRHELIF